MNIKSLMLGSAAALVAVTGARAADAIVTPEPEAVEYVRVCDVYGAGFFYIPGTETCLKIGGYFRYEMRYNYVALDDRFSKLARFAPTFTVKQETEWGTLTGFAELEFDWRNDGTQGTNLNHMYIELAGIRLGKGDAPWTRFLGYGGPTLDGGNYGFAYGAGNTSELSYTFDSGSGFKAILAVTEDADFDWAPDASLGARYDWDGGYLGAIGAYDESANGWAIKGVGGVTFGAVGVELHGFYANNANAYAVDNVSGNPVQWSVLGGVSAALSERFALGAQVQYFSNDFTGVDGSSWEVIVNTPVTIAKNFVMTPEVRYASATNVATDYWAGRVRFNYGF